MFRFTPIPEINLGFWQLSTHGLLIAVGFLVSVVLAARAARRRGMDPASLETAAAWGAIMGLIGARLVYLLFWGEGIGFWEAFQLWHGGLSSHGGYVFGIIAAIVCLKVKKADIRSYLDAAAPYFLLGWAIGRVGCFFNWDSYGRISDSVFSVLVYGEGRLPTQLFESFGYLLAFAALAVFARRLSVLRKGSVTALSLGLFAAVRFVVDFWRGDPLSYLIFSQALTGGIIILATLFVILNIKRKNMV